MSYQSRSGLTAPPRRSQALRSVPSSRPRSANYPLAGSSYLSPLPSLSANLSSYRSASPSHHNYSTKPLASYTRSYSSRLSPSRFAGLTHRVGSTGSLSAISTKSGDSEGYASEDKSRVGSTTSLSVEDEVTTEDTVTADGEPDYKKLWEKSQEENSRLRERLRRVEQELTQQHTANGTGLSEHEKRERRAMERKLSEMEEELKTLMALKQENQRLKDENGALIRVISKLSK